MPGYNFGTGGGGFNFSSLSSAPTTATTTCSSSSTPQFAFTTPSAPTSTSTSSSGISFTGFAGTGTSTSATTSTTTIPAATSANSSYSFNFSTPTTTSASGVFSSFNLPTNTPTLNLGVKPTSTTSIGSTTTASTFSFALPISSTALTGTAPTALPFGSTAPVATSTVLPVAKDGTATVIVPPASSATLTGPPTTASSLLGTSASLTTATTTTSISTPGGIGVSTNLSMRPLEERLNKWLVELKEQEERFVRQAAHVNAWDQILQNGHDQVQSLKDTLHTVKSDQSRLEAEIDFIRGQQEELERLLEPLESATTSNPATQLHQGDRQRDNMYYLAQSLDAQLRQMTDDLGKVIEHLNTNEKPWQPNDPVALVARILSAHMDTLKWVDQNTALLSQKMEEVARVAASAGKKG